MSRDGDGGRPGKVGPDLEVGSEPTDPGRDGLDAEGPLYVHPTFSPKDAFLRHHGALRSSMSAHALPGYLAAVLDGDTYVETWIAASTDQVRAAIIGRHGRATLVFPQQSATAALRHMALLVGLDGKRPVARLLDLQTEIGFGAPDGRRLEAICTDGPAFFHVGGAVLALLPTGSDRQLDSSPEAAWQSLPEVTWRRQREPADGDAATIWVREGPRGCMPRLCRAAEIPYGMASVASDGDETHIMVSGRALDDGFIIGRYDRCEVGGPEADESLSRVHLLVVREGKRVLAIDTASTNGTYVGDDRVHLHELSESARIDLGGVVDFTWRTCN